MEDPQVRIKNHDIPLFVAASLFFDGLQVVMVPIFALPFIGIPLAVLLPFLVTVTAFILFSFWFATKRVNYFSGKQAYVKVLAVFGTLVIELLPFIGSLPAITGGVAVVIFASRVEDTVGKRRKLEGMVRRRDREARRTDFWAGAARGALGAIGLRNTGNNVETTMQRAQAASHAAQANRRAAQVFQGRRKVTDREAETGIRDLKGQIKNIRTAWMEEKDRRKDQAENIERMYNYIPRNPFTRSQRKELQSWNRDLKNFSRGTPEE